MSVKVWGSARVDNRNELARLLRLDEPPAGDLDLIGLAYERWGDACVERLLGDFAFAIEDGRRHRLFAARDPLGVRPLCYRPTEEGVAIAGSATELEAICGRPLEVADDRVADVLVGELECADQTSTLYRDVQRVPPGHTLVFESGRPTVRPYWAPDAVLEAPAATDAAYEEGFRSVFSAAVDCRLAGTTASMLSGGLDSSAIVAFARRHDRPLTTLSAITLDPGCEETRSVRSVLALPGLDPVLIVPSDVASYGDAIATFIRQMELPFDASMVIPLLVYAEAKRRGFTAVLDGVDGDCVASLELDYIASLVRGGAWTRGFKESVGLAAFYRGTYAPWGSATRVFGGQALRAWMPAAAKQRYRRAADLRRVNETLSRSLVRRDVARRTGIPDRLVSLWQLRARISSDPRERHAVELVHPQVAAALERYHRVAASQGIDARHPFFDRRVVEFCLALPWDQKVRGGWSKSIVRRSCDGRLPDDVRWRRGRWVRLGPVFLAAAISAVRELIEAELATGLPELEPYVEGRLLNRAAAEFRTGHTEAGETVWQAVTLNLWLRRIRGRRYDPAARANGPAAGQELSGSGGALIHF